MTRNDDVPGRHRPDRPALIELASALLVVGGVLSLVASIEVIARVADQTGDVDPIAWLALAFGVATVVLGVLTRFGRAWIVTVNVTAVAGFLEITSLTPAGLLVGALDVFVVIVLIANRPWFAWRPGGDAEAPPPS